MNKWPILPLLSLALLVGCQTGSNSHMSGPFPPGTISPPGNIRPLPKAPVKDKVIDDSPSYSWHITGPRPVGTFSCPKRAKVVIDTTKIGPIEVNEEYVPPEDDGSYEESESVEAEPEAEIEEK